MTPMRIALASETYPPQINGVSRTLERLVHHLAQRGDRVLLLVPRYDGVQSTLSGVDRREFGAVPLPMYKEVVLPFVSPGRIARELETFKPDLIHIATEGPLGWATLKAAARLGLPVVSSYHSNFSQYLRLYGFGVLETATWVWLRRFHNATLRTFCPTPSIRTILESKGFHRVSTWSRGVDSERFHPGRRCDALRRQWEVNPDGIVLGYAGRLATEKNLDVLMDAWSRMRKEKTKLLLIGDGPLRKKLEEREEKGVIFAGYLKGEELGKAYASADLFVFPSLTETFGNVILEAMASGLPAVGFRAPGPQDIIEDGRTGRLVEERDAESLRRSVEALVDDRELLRQMSHNARSHAQTRTWDRIMEQLREDYAAVLKECGARKCRELTPS